VSAVLDIRDAVHGEEQSDGLAAGVLTGHEDLPQLFVAHALDGAGMAGERAAAALAGESLPGEQAIVCSSAWSSWTRRVTSPVSSAARVRK